ncbi:helix-turn-helix domain-containing protein [Streptomyces prasinopilosus]|uniref:Helix-turn-helix domain-containing protein n=1 Tax=Streptomyces prasinopilosus TaxID=67344 RepID=A0A1G6NY54_9ACTN|nr:XRE family transcriptional regulator [Streptomyces prasinopilosus]SDC72853.1 Helix-turn-helix domain-containing protein [Streptomyces prasinopilosus]
MPRWKALPEELDPQIREFTSQLRRVVDRSGMSVASVSDRTGYSKTSWERYLNGRLLAPKGAVVALAEVTGTNPVHLTTMWELAERAWSRSEMRHDMTMEAIRISQARSALSEVAGPSSAGAGGGGHKGGGAAVRPGVAGPAGGSPSVPPQPTASDARDASGTNSWGMAGYAGPSPSGHRSGPGHPAAQPAGSGRPPGAPDAQGTPPRGAAGRGRSAGPGVPGGRRRTGTFVTGALGALVVIASAFYVTGLEGDKEGAAAKSPSPTASVPANLPAGVECSGDSCDGEDAESMGCSGDLVTTTQTATVGTALVEVRYSKVCGAAWGRITQAAQGDKVEITGGRTKQSAGITEVGGTVAYTPMTAVAKATDARACVVLASGEEGCTEETGAGAAE